MSEKAADWVEKSLKIPLNEFQRKAVDLLCRAMRCGPYDFAGTFKKADWNYGKGVRFTVRGSSISTWDTNGLTTLVIGAHEEGIRVEIEPVNFQCIAIIMHSRPNRLSDLSWSNHPTIETAIEHYRK